jgi:hypothetical protein
MSSSALILKYACFSSSDLSVDDNNLESGILK